MGQADLYRALGTTGLRCHPLGFGCYRVAAGNGAHEAALRAYLAMGGNLIDTSANYGDGLSEVLVGQVLQDQPRERLVIVTKGGYIQGRNLDLARSRNFPETVYYGEGLWHSIHPGFLETQVEGSLERMRLDRIDVYLLHNPEYFLTEKEHHGGPSAADHEEFYRRVREAFRFLESQVDRGRLSWYGISSNNFGLPADDRTHTSVSRCLAEARAVRADHHFRAIQLPLNLYEPGGALERANEGRTVLDYCADEGLGVVVNRPLNAFDGRRMIRLADFVKTGQAPPGAEVLHAMLEPIRSQEARLALELGVPLVGGKQGVAEVIEELVPRLQSNAHWEQTVGPRVIVPVRKWVEETDRRLGDDMRWAAWRLDFVQALEALFEEIGRFLGAREQETSDRVRSRLREAGYAESGESLSRMAIHTLLGLRGLDAVLCGMRRLEYVEDAMGAATLPPLDGRALLERFTP
jgi:aryl-alcohol dehydrogenase-like predicted oxidoreductase